MISHILLLSPVCPCLGKCYETIAVCSSVVVYQGVTNTFRVGFKRILLLPVLHLCGKPQVFVLPVHSYILVY